MMSPGMVRPPIAPMISPGMVRPPSMMPAGVIAAGPTTKQLQAYVGKIPESVPDGFIKNLLEQCGSVAKWERVTDPTSGKPKPFGFCKFIGADSVLRALRLLNGIEFDGGALLLKVDQKTQAFLDEHEAEQRLAAQAGGEEEGQKDESALVTIQELIANRAATVKDMPPDRDEQQKNDQRDRDAERQEREAAREREREERQKRDEENKFRDREREWERREGDRARDREREKERLANREKETERRTKECLETDPDIDFDTWWNKYQDRGYQRRRQREREAEDDDSDRRREKEELDAIEEEKAKERAVKQEMDEDGEDKAPMKLSFGIGGSGKRKVDLFDEDEESKKMKLTPIEYTDEEIQAREALAKEAEPQKTPEEKEAEMKRLIATIPIGKEDLLKYDVNWAIVDKGKLVAEKMAPWVTKKIADYLGEEEPMLIKYVLEMLTEHAEASAIIEKLAVVLEDEAETFVIKLWRYLIFESMRLQAGL